MSGLDLTTKVKVLTLAPKQTLLRVQSRGMQGPTGTVTPELIAARDAAQQAATDAGTAASTATTKAGEALGSASAANGSAQAAASSASSARESADAAALAAGRANEGRRLGLPTEPMNLGYSLTPAPTPYEFTDQVSSVIGFDKTWMLFGEDGQCHSISKQGLVVGRGERAADWTLANPWFTAISAHVGDSEVSPNTFLARCARETWTYPDPGVAATVTTGYAVAVGTGDKNGAVYRSPTVFFWRDGQAKVQSLATMLKEAGIMGGIFSTPRCLMGASRVDVDSFYLHGSGKNQSTNPDPSRPTFGLMVLTLNSAKTQTGATGVTSLTWLDCLPNLQAVMPAGETIVNVPAVADKLVSGILYVIVVTKDGGGVRRMRMVEFDHAAKTANLNAQTNKSTGAAIFPITPPATDTTQVGSISVGANGILWTFSAASSSVAYYRAFAESQWRPVTNQVFRAIGLNGLGIEEAKWDASRSRFVVITNSSTGGAGWLDADCKQGYPYTSALPAKPRLATHSCNPRGAWADAAGVMIVGASQMAMFIPPRAAFPTRVLWGCRITPTANNNEVSVSEGEVEIYDSLGNKKRVYVAPATLGALSASGFTYAIVATSAGAIQRPGNGFASGTDYPEPALANQCLLGQVARTATGAPITTAEISQIGLARDGMS